MTNDSTNLAPHLAWLRLVRIPALPSAISNILMGFLLAHGSWSPPVLLVTLILASAFFYTAGMILNDVFDFKVDSEMRPERPLPSRQIKLGSAKLVGFVFLTMGLLFCAVASGYTSLSNESGLFSEWRPLLIGALLAGFVCLYNIWLKRTALAPIAMGVCRGLNVLLGASTAAVSADYPTWLFGFSSPVWVVAISLSVLIAGVTWFAQRESIENKPYSLLPAGVVLIVGIAGFALIPTISGADFAARVDSLFPLLILLIAITVVRRVFMAIASGMPNDIQQAVVATLRSLIIFDASICYLAAPEKSVYAIVVVCLLIPSVWLGRYIRST